MTTFLAILMLAGAYALGALTTLLFMLKFNKICSRCWDADGLISQLQEENRRMARELNNYRP